MNPHSYFFVTVLFNIFMTQTLTDYFWGLYKNMNCAFPLKADLFTLLNADKFNIFSKIKNMLEIKREELRIPTTKLLHIKTGTMIVTCS